MTREDLSDLRVLVVDDNERMRALLGILLTAFGIRFVHACATAEDALRDIRRANPGLILCDWEMKPMNGLDLVRRLRHVDNKPFCRLPVVMVTAHAEAERLHAAQSAGVSRFVIKPFTPRTLLERIKSTLADPMELILEEDSYVPAGGPPVLQQGAGLDGRFLRCHSPRRFAGGPR